MAAQVATRSAMDVISKVLPPASPFSELLRKSKFATFDPTIRQAYSAPPSYAQRGNYGLKRPIANRKTHGYIVLKNFEEHAQYVEWDNAKEQVRWIKMIEEMNISMQLQTTSTWASGLGPLESSKENGLDSDFCPGETPYVRRIRIEPAVNGKMNATSPQPPTESPISADTLLPTRGKGAYGAKAEFLSSEEKGKMFLQPTISGMPPPVFRRYIKKLRKMRPEFIAFVRAELKKRWNLHQAGINPDIFSDAELISEFGSSVLNQNLHFRFLGLKNEADYHVEPISDDISDPERAKLRQDALEFANKPQPIRPQPHRYAGLMYAQPTAIETLFTTKVQPGLLLESPNSQRADTPRGIVSFGGIVSRLVSPGVGAEPLFHSNSAANLEGLPQSSRMMRVTNLTLMTTPNVVGRSAHSKPLSQVEMRLSVNDELGEDQNGSDNPYTPGSYEYNSLKPSRSQTGSGGMTIPRPHGRTSWATTAPSSSLYDVKSKITAKDPQHATFRTLNQNERTLNQISSMLGKQLGQSTLRRQGKKEKGEGAAGPKADPNS